MRLVLATLLFAFAACSTHTSDDVAPTTVVAPPTTVATTVGSEGATSTPGGEQGLEGTCVESPPLTIVDNPLAELLVFVPDDEASRRYLMFAHPALAYQDLKTPIPSADCDPQHIEEWAETAMTGIRLLVPAPSIDYGAIPANQIDAWGFSFLSHRAELVTGDPSDQLRLRIIDVPIDDVREAVLTDPDWSAQVDIVESPLQGALIADWGNEIDLDRKSLARPLGRGGVLAMADQIVAQSHTAPVVEASFSSAESGANLGNDSTYVSLAA